MHAPPDFCASALISGATRRAVRQDAEPSTFTGERVGVRLRHELSITMVEPAERADHGRHTRGRFPDDDAVEHGWEWSAFCDFLHDSRCSCHLISVLERCARMATLASEDGQPPKWLSPP
jgi:hypothetical protein